MKVVILAGGLGTRLAEETKKKPKPLIEIGGMPLLLHIMMNYSFYGINDFIICCGYKGYMIKDYFAKNSLSKTGTTFHFQLNKANKKFAVPCTVKLVETGLETMTGGRVKRIKKFIENETFCLTYGDDLKNVNITELIKFHYKKKRMATVTAVHLPNRFGILHLRNDKVLKFKEKSAVDERWINGGYYVLEPDVLDYIHDDSTVFERQPLEKLASKGQLSAYRFKGEYWPLDTIQDKIYLESLWNQGKAHWKIWK